MRIENQLFNSFLKEQGLFGIQFESFLSSLAHNFSADYNSGIWQETAFGEDGGFFLDLKDNKEYVITNTQNYYNAGSMNSRTFSIAILLMALNLFGEKLYTNGKEEMAANFFNLYYKITDNLSTILENSDDRAKLFAFLD